MFEHIQTFYKDQKNIRKSKIFPIIIKEMDGKIDSMDKLERVTGISDAFNAKVMKYINAIIEPLPVLDPKRHQQNLSQANDIAHYLKSDPDFLKLEENWYNKNFQQKKETVIDATYIIEDFFDQEIPVTSYNFVYNMPGYNIGYAKISANTISAVANNQSDCSNIFINTSYFALNHYNIYDYIGCIIHERRHTLQPLNLLGIWRKDEKESPLEYFWSWAEQDANDISCLTLKKLGDLSKSETIQQGYRTAADRMTYFPQKPFDRQKLFMEKLIRFRGHVHV